MHVSPSDKRYIGITCRSVQARWGKDGYGYKGQAFENAIKKYGWNNFQHIVLFENLSKGDAESKEIELIAHYKTTDKRYGYNVENGGKSVGRFTEETKRKISESRKGKVPWNKGIPRTEEEKRKMSLSHVGLTAGEKNGNYGKHLSEERKAKLREAKKGKPSYWKGRKIPEYMSRKLHEASSKKIVRLEDNKVYASITAASREMGVSITAISNCLNGRTKRAAGHHWKYADAI